MQLKYVFIVRMTWNWDPYIIYDHTYMTSASLFIRFTCLVIEFG